MGSRGQLPAVLLEVVLRAAMSSRGSPPSLAKRKKAEVGDLEEKLTAQQLALKRKELELVELQKLLGQEEQTLRKQTLARAVRTTSKSHRSEQDQSGKTWRLKTSQLLRKLLQQER